MKIPSTHFTLSAAVVCKLATKEVIDPAGVDFKRDGSIFTPQSNYNGWVNPEDLTPMPQCIAQQDQSSWLSAMTACTEKRCTSHFGIICTHHQWLTQLSCLSTTFSSDLVKGYLPYCSRSVLAKAQLYRWIRSITGRTWLVDVGDANELQQLSAASLTKGYAPVGITYDAPVCLTDSVSTPSIEPFQHVMASCSFTDATQHTGNAARPWEYSESLQSMTTLDFETVGYNLTGCTIQYGDYFDKECFCSVFTLDFEKEPCSRPGQIDLTMERLWMNATCGPTSLPDNWTGKLKTTEFAYIPVEDWDWPRCVMDMPKRVTEQIDLCETDACEVDSNGYCRVRRAVDRACFCHNIRYDSCGGSCQAFETRKDYLNWLYNLCGNVPDWHGLPHNWRQLTAPTPLEMIPWQWTIKPTEKCVSNDWKLGSLVLVNIATFLAALLGLRTRIDQIAPRPLGHQQQRSWIVTGFFMTALQLFANWFNAFLVQKFHGYEDVPIIQLMLLWCSIPRVAWLTIVLIGIQSFGDMNLSAASSFFFTEIILQLFSSYYMLLTINYGREHQFYFGGLENAERGRSAKAMYAGAGLWLSVIIVTCFYLVRATYKTNCFTGSSSLDLPKLQRSERTTLTIATNSQRGNYSVYGTLTVESQNNRVSREEHAKTKLFAAMVISMYLLWIAQWLFWGGFIGLSSESYCPPKLGTLTAVWAAFALAATTVGTTFGIML